MRAVLPRLEEMSAAKVAEALRTSIAELGLNEEEEGSRLFGTLRFVEGGLSENLQPLLSLLGLHEGYADAYYMEVMAKQVHPDWTRSRIDALLAALGSAGLVREIGNAIYEMHPLLTSYLRSRGAASEACRRAFVDIMATVADGLAKGHYHEQRFPFLLHGANFHYALELSQTLAMDQHLLALTQSLAAYAQNSRDFVESSRLFHQLAVHAASHGKSEVVATTYHQLGMIAQEQRDFATAREWYLKSLAISEQQGNLHGAASTYGQLGILAGRQDNMEDCGRWLIRCIRTFLQAHDQHAAEITANNFLISHRQASPQDKQKLEAIWREANLGPFPTDPNP